MLPFSWCRGRSDKMQFLISSPPRQQPDGGCAEQRAARGFRDDQRRAGAVGEGAPGVGARDVEGAAVDPRAGVRENVADGVLRLGLDDVEMGLAAERAAEKSLDCEAGDFELPGVGVDLLSEGA